MKGKKLLIFLSVLLVISLVVIFISTNGSWNKLELYPLNHPTILMGKEDAISFYESGFVISGDKTHFFDFKGNEIACPFSIDGKVLEDDKIDTITDNHMLLNGNAVYRITYPELEEILTVDSSIVKLYEYDDIILLILQDKDGFLRLNSYDQSSQNLWDLSLDDNLVFLDFNYNIHDSTLSLLVLDVNGSFPTSKVINYDDELSLFGVTSSMDEVYYRVFRLSSKIVLIGTQKLICYNIEGEVEWEFESNHINNFNTIVNDDQFVIYFDNIIKEDRETEPFNTMVFNYQGDFTKIDLPAQLTGMITYGQKFIANQSGKKLLLLDKNLKVEGEVLIADMDNIYWNKYSPHNIYISKQDGSLEIYSTKQEDSLK